MATVLIMAAVRLVLAAIVASASAPAVVEAATEADCTWCLGDARSSCDASRESPRLALPCDVRAALANALATPLFARPELPPPPTVAIAELLPIAAVAPLPAPVLADAPKTSPPA